MDYKGITAMVNVDNKSFIQVEYDQNYFGGNYTDVGSFVLIPADKVDTEKAFEEQTGLSRKNIIHYSPDELYNSFNELID